MRPGAFLRDKLFHLLALAFSVAFSAALLAVLSVPPVATGFLCLVLVLCGLLPLWVEYARKRRFYGELLAALEGLEEQYLLSELLEEPSFTEGQIFCGAMAQVNKSMNDAVAAARRDMREYREYIEAWVHEIKTPIASAQLALENYPGALAERLGTELFQIDGYVEQALFYARSGAVEQDYLVRAMPLRDAAAGAVRRYARPLIAAGFQIDVEGLDATVYADPKWVEFILGQLISNAIKYRGDHPRLVFSQRVEEQRVVLTVVDNGVGIPASDLPRVFDKGFTGTNGRMGATRATGLGLYLCKKLCHKLALGISADAQAGCGTQVSLIFPRSEYHMAGR